MIEAYIINWNEAETLHLTIKHYQKFCSSVVIMDNHSTDNSREIAKSLGCKVKTFGRPGELSDQAYLDVKNSVWKRDHPGNDRRDWVIVCDADEILSGYPSNKEATIYKTIGWNVFDYHLPTESWFETTNGYYEENYSKTVIFNPKEIKEINFRIGGHVSNPKGNVVWAQDKIFLLHYRNVGGPDRLVERHKLYRPRMSKENLQKNWGIHYMISDEERVREWNEKYQKSKPLLPVGQEC